MLVQRIYRESRIALMRQKVKNEPAALDVYASGAAFEAVPDDDLLNTTVSVADSAPNLAAPAGTKQDVAAHDAENAILIYGYLGPLTRTQAADARLWTTLAHTTFWGYTRARWGEQDRQRLTSAVLRHWFVPEGAGKAALRTQSISRLWWAAHLTHAPWEQDAELSVFKTADRFRFTRILLRRQQIYFDLIERNYGSDLRLRICVLDALDRHMPSLSWRDVLSREASKRLNLLLKNRQVGSLELDSLRELCDALVADVATRLASVPGGPPSPT
jgi:hypothetical protein